MDKKIGFFKSNNPYRDIVGRCIKECDRLKFALAGIRLGGECWCMNRASGWNKEKKTLAEKHRIKCKKGCSRPDNSMNTNIPACGGDQTLSVYNAGMLSSRLSLPENRD